MFSVTDITFLCAEKSFLYNGGHRYVFPGAEVYFDPDDHEDQSDSSSSDEEEENTPTGAGGEKGGDEQQKKGGDEQPKKGGDEKKGGDGTFEDIVGGEEGGEDWMALHASLDTSSSFDEKDSKGPTL